MKKSIFFVLLLFLFLFFITCISTYVVHSDYSFTASSPQYYFSSEIFCWPLPGYYTISSPFGFRISPTTGASSYHSGIDIPAPIGTNIYATFSGKVTYLDFERSQWLYSQNQ